MESITVAVITGRLLLIGVCFSNMQGNKNIEHQLDKKQATTDTKIKELTREVRTYNNFCSKSTSFRRINKSCKL